MNKREKMVKVVPTEATAVVEYGSAEEFLEAVDAESMQARILTSFEQEELAEAHAVLAKYDPMKVAVELGDLIQSVMVNFKYTKQRAQLAVEGRMVTLDQRFKVQTEDGTTHRVNMGTSVDYDDFAVRLSFVRLDPASALFIPGVQEAAALCLIPAQSYSAPPSTFTSGTGDVLKVPQWTTVVSDRDYNRGETMYFPNYKNGALWSHISFLFPSEEDALLVMRMVKQALETVRRISRKVQMEEAAAFDPIQQVKFGPLETDKAAPSRRMAL